MTTIDATEPLPMSRGAARGKAAPEAAATEDAAFVLGEPHRFTVLFDRHAATLHRYCARRVGPDLADDLVSQTYLTAFANRHRYDRTRPNALPWLYGICTNLLRRHRRTEVRAYRLLARTGVDPLSTTEVTERAIDRADAAAASPALAKALAKLPARQRDVLLLLALADLSYAEISAALGIPEGTVRSRLSRARSRVRKELGATTTERSTP